MAETSFPTVKKGSGPTGGRKPNPADPVVKAALNQGWQQFSATSENAGKLGNQIRSAATAQGLFATVRDRTEREGLVHFRVTEVKPSRDNPDGKRAQ